jgi:hypothetical protein
MRLIDIIAVMLITIGLMGLTTGLMGLIIPSSPIKINSYDLHRNCIKGQISHFLQHHLEKQLCPCCGIQIRYHIQKIQSPKGPMKLIPPIKVLPNVVIDASNIA